MFGHSSLFLIGLFSAVYKKSTYLISHYQPTPHSTLSTTSFYFIRYLQKEISTSRQTDPMIYNVTKTKTLNYIPNHQFVVHQTLGSKSCNLHKQFTHTEAKNITFFYQQMQRKAMEMRFNPNPQISKKYKSFRTELISQ